ncbi:Putative Phage-related protein-like (fragment) [Vibrio coralliirubri]
METFQVTGASAKNYEVSWTLGAMDLLRVRTPRRRQMRNRCCWRYKSKECGYTGAQKYCDLSLQGLNGCTAHDNEGNFGGFPGITNQ